MKILKILQKRNKHLLFVICILTILQLFAIAINQIQKGDQKPIDFKKFLAQQIGKNSFGIWKKNDKEDKTFFKEDKGIGSFVIIGKESQFLNSKFQKGIYGFEINLHEKINIASNLVNFVIRNVQFNPKKNKIVIPKQESLVRLINSNQVVQGKKCIFQGQFFYEYYSVQQHYFVKFKINSDNCPEFNVELNSNIQTVQIKYLEVFFHVIFSFVFITLQLYLLYVLDQKLLNNLNLCLQTSEITWLIFAGFQLNMAFEQFLVISFDYPFYTSLLLIGIGQFIIFFVIILRILAIKMRQQIDYWTNEGIEFSLRNYLIKIYLLAHAIVLGTFYLSIVYSDKPQFFFIWSFAILPQIIKNWNAKQRFIQSNDIMSIFYIVCIMQLIYDKFYKYNFKYLNITKGFNLHTGSYIISISFILLVIQVFQENYSSYFLLPKFFRQNQEYDYFTNFKDLPERDINLENNLSEHLDTDNESSVSKETTCIICLISLKKEMKDEDWEKEIQNEQLLDYIKYKTEKFELMVTPCKHVYHSSCLLAWMNVKLECPLCKEELPGIV